MNNTSSFTYRNNAMTKNTVTITKQPYSYMLINTEKRAVLIITPC
jgi:hypothetical protein